MASSIGIYFQCIYKRRNLVVLKYTNFFDIFLKFKVLSEVNDNLKKVIQNMSKKEIELALQNRFPYIFTKAYYFLLQGPKTYSEKDALHLPDESFKDSDLKIVKIGCEQLIKGIGFSSYSPLSNIGVRGCNKLFKLFHFEMVEQMVFKNNDGVSIDKMVFRHIVDQKKITYYNSVVM